MSPFAQSLRQAQILILEIPKVFLRLKSSPFLTLDKIERFETASRVYCFSILIFIQSQSSIIADKIRRIFQYSSIDKRWVLRLAFFCLSPSFFLILLL